MAGRDEMPRCEHGKCADEACVECCLDENDQLRERVDALCDRVTALEAQVVALDAQKCSHTTNDWGDACTRCNDSIVKAGV